MSPVSLHLLSCHVPLIGACLTAGLILFALRRRDAGLTLAADGATVVTASACAVAWATGPAALDALEPWIDPAGRDFADRHAGLGDVAMLALAAAGLLALWGLFLARAGRPSPRWRLGVLAGALFVGIVLAAWAGHEGGRIRHEELRGDTPPTGEFGG